MTHLRFGACAGESRSQASTPASGTPTDRALKSHPLRKGTSSEQLHATLHKLRTLQNKIDKIDAVLAMQSDDEASNGGGSEGGSDSAPLDDMLTHPLERIRRDLCLHRQALMMAPSHYFRRFRNLRVQHLPYTLLKTSIGCLILLLCMFVSLIGRDILNCQVCFKLLAD